MRLKRYTVAYIKWYLYTKYYTGIVVVNSYMQSNSSYMYIAIPIDVLKHP